mgnify:CR=1 FL=1
MSHFPKIAGNNLESQFGLIKFRIYSPKNILVKLSFNVNSTRIIKNSTRKFASNFNTTIPIDALTI